MTSIVALDNNWVFSLWREPGGYSGGRTFLWRARATSGMTGMQWSRGGWRKRVIVGYQGVSVRFSIQRQSGAKERRVHTGRARAPAKWAMEVSTEITRSREPMNAAVSVMSFISGVQS